MADISLTVNVVGWVQTTSGGGGSADFSFLNVAQDLLVATADNTPGRFGIIPNGSVLGAVGGVWAGVVLSTLNVVEDTNLYWTTARADAWLAPLKGAASGVASLDGSALVPVSQLTNVNSVNPGLTPTNYTPASATYAGHLQGIDTALGLLGGGGGVTDHGALTGLGDDDHTQYHTDARALVWLGTRSTTDLAEGTNLYWTSGRFDAAFAANSVTALLDVTSAGSGQIITATERTNLGTAFAHVSLTNNPHGVTAAQVGADPAGTAAGLIAALDTDAIPEGVTNLYWTSARFTAAFGALITDVGSGAVITAAERTKLTGIEALADVTDAANVTAALASVSVTAHNDVSDAGSGAIITSAERSKLAALDALGARTQSIGWTAGVRADVTAIQHWIPRSNITVTGVRVMPVGAGAPASAGGTVTLGVTDESNAAELLVSAAESIEGGSVDVSAPMTLTLTTGDLDLDAGTRVALALTFPSDTTPAVDANGVPTGSVYVEILYVER